MNGKKEERQTAVGFEEGDEESEERMGVCGLGDVPISTEETRVDLMEGKKKVNQLNRIVKSIRD